MKTLLLTAALALASTGGLIAVKAQSPSGQNPLKTFDHAWEDDSTWYDGKAEVAKYDATRMIYGKLRRYEATAYTNKESADPKTKTKSATNKGREVFKHHLREDVPTENYDYHLSTMTYVGTEDFKSLKIDVGTIEDCGATYKQFVNHDGELAYLQSSYFPDEGRKAGEYEPPAAFAYQDALFTVLRGFPFNKPPKGPIELALVPDQTTTHLSPAGFAPGKVSYVGQETLELPIGRVAAHHLRVEVPEVTGDDAKATAKGSQVHDYWFAAEGEAPWLHVLVRYTGPDALTMSLRSLDRSAYWERKGSQP